MQQAIDYQQKPNGNLLLVVATKQRKIGTTHLVAQIKQMGQPMTLKKILA